jgi:hypothetical protein
MLGCNMLIDGDVRINKIGADLKDYKLFLF